MLVFRDGFYPVIADSLFPVVVDKSFIQEWLQFSTRRNKRCGNGFFHLDDFSEWKIHFFGLVRQPVNVSCILLSASHPSEEILFLFALHVSEPLLFFLPFFFGPFYCGQCFAKCSFLSGFVVIHVQIFNEFILVFVYRILAWYIFNISTFVAFSTSTLDKLLETFHYRNRLIKFKVLRLTRLSRLRFTRDTIFFHCYFFNVIFYEFHYFFRYFSRRFHR